MSKDQKNPIAVPLDDAKLEEVSGGMAPETGDKKASCAGVWKADLCWRDSWTHCPMLVVISKEQKIGHAAFVFSCNLGNFSNQAHTFYGLF